MSAEVMCDEPVVGVLVARINGELDLASSGHVQGAICEAIRRSSPRRLVLDLNGVTLLSSKGIAMLLGVRRDARRAGAYVVLLGCRHRNVAVPLRITGVLPLFDTCPDLDHALGTCRPIRARAIPSLRNAGPR